MNYPFNTGDIVRVKVSIDHPLKEWNGLHFRIEAIQKMAGKFTVGGTVLKPSNSSLHSPGDLITWDSIELLVLEKSGLPVVPYISPFTGKKI